MQQKQKGFGWNIGKTFRLEYKYMVWQFLIGIGILITLIGLFGYIVNFNK